MYGLPNSQPEPSGVDGGIATVAGIVVAVIYAPSVFHYASPYFVNSIQSNYSSDIVNLMTVGLYWICFPAVYLVAKSTCEFLIKKIKMSRGRRLF